MRYHFNDVELSPGAINAACNWFASNALARIAAVENGLINVDDKARYIAQQREEWATWLRCEFEPVSLDFLKVAYAYQTGKRPPIL